MCEEIEETKRERERGSQRASKGDRNGDARKGLSRTRRYGGQTADSIETCGRD